MRQFLINTDKYVKHIFSKSLGIAALTATLITASLAVTDIPVYATGGVKNTQLGAAALAPDMTSVQADQDLDTKNRVTNAQTVYYGTSGTQKLEWLVIGYNGSGAVSMSDTVTLFASDNLATGQEYRENQSSHSYVDSDIKSVVDAYYDSLFTSGEKAAIQARTLAHGEYSSDASSLCDGISDTGNPKVNLWLLSTKEADLIGQTYRSTEGETYWWLRSPGDNTNMAADVQVGRVIADGCNVGFDQGVRPAFNIDPSSILLTSSIEDGKTSGEVGAGALTATSDYDAINDWKLTIVDSDRSGFEAYRTDRNDLLPGNTLKISYNGAKTGENEYVSAIITDANDAILYYGHVAQCSAANGTASINIPSDNSITNTCKLYVFQEQCNGFRETDLSSEMTDITAKAPKRNPEAGDFVVTLPSDTDYDGNPKTATANVAAGVTGMGKITVKYFDSKDQELAKAPTSPGTYRVKLDVAEGESYKSATGITKNDWTFTVSEPQKAAKPTFSPEPGTYIGTQQVAINCATSNARIYYTTDGTNPVITGTLYSGPISVSETTTITAIALRYDMNDSEVAEGTYTIKPGAVYQVKVTAGGNVTAKATPDSGKTGTDVTLTVTPNDGYVFKEWIVVSGGVSLADKTSASTTFKIGSADVEVMPTFATAPVGPTPQKININDTTVKLSKTSLGYIGKAQKPTVKSVKLNGKTLNKDTDYTVSWSDSKSKKLGTYKVTITGKGNYTGSKTVSYKIVQGGNPLTVAIKKKTLRVSLSKLKKENQTIKCSKYLNVSGNQGALTYKKANGNRNIVIGKKSGKITVKKGLKSGTYKVTISVKAAGNKNYKSATKKVTVKIVV